MLRAEVFIAAYSNNSVCWRNECWWRYLGLTHFY